MVSYSVTIIEVGASPAEPEWGWQLAAHKLIQHEDGAADPLARWKLSVNKAITRSEVGGQGTKNGMTAGGEFIPCRAIMLYMLMSRLQVITTRLASRSQLPTNGISLVFLLARGTKSNADDATTFEKYYTMVVNPESDTRRKVNFEEEGDGGKGFIEGIDGCQLARPSDNVYNINILRLDNSICVMYINDTVCYTNRIYSIQKNCWSINNYGGNITVSNLKISQY